MGVLGFTAIAGSIPAFLICSINSKGFSAHAKEERRRKSSQNTKIKNNLKERRKRRKRRLVASMWKVYELAPASAKSFTHFSGSETIKWQSKNPVNKSAAFNRQQTRKQETLKVPLQCFRRALITGAPIVKFGTKCPSLQEQRCNSATNQRKE
jgi:hypothetical protein